MKLEETSTQDWLTSLEARLCRLEAVFDELIAAVELYRADRGAK